MKIAVTTPTGNVGRHVVAMLVRAGIRPTVLVRDPVRLEAAVRDRVEAVTVDLTDADGVVAATVGVDALFWVDPPSTGPDPVEAYARLGANAARAVTENSIPRTVLLSSIGAEQRSGMGEIDGLARTEELLDATGASVLHLRCGYFFTNLAVDAVRSGRIQVVLDPGQPLAWVAPRDIAEVATARLLNTDWSGRVVQAVHGPVDLSWEQAVRVVSAATGHPLAVERITEEMQRASLRTAGLGETRVEAVLGMSTGTRDGSRPEQPRDVTTTTPSTLGGWAWEVLRPRL